MGSPLDHVFNLQAAMTEEEEYPATLLGVLELVKSGTVCFVDPGSTKYPDACLQAYEDSGIRVIPGECVPTARLRSRCRGTPGGGGQAQRRVHREVARRARRAHPGVGDAVLARDLLRRAAPGIKRVVDERGTMLTLHHGSGPQALATTRSATAPRHGVPGLDRRPRQKCLPRALAGGGGLRDRVHGPHRRDGGDVPGHGGQGRARRGRVRAHARVAGRRRAGGARLRLARTTPTTSTSSAR